jgi:FAD dependent oxidoreductase
MNRRRFLAAAASTPWLFGRSAPATDGGEAYADVVIVGGGTGGCAAALAALRGGASVIMTEETAWVGGQLTQQAVPPDENRWIELGGANRSYLQLREAIRDVYRKRTNPPLTDAARKNLRLNPGNGWVSRICHDPRVSVAVLDDWLKPHVAAGKLRLLRHWKVAAADVAGDRVRSVTGRDLRTGTTTTLTGKFFLDATEQGDLLPMAKVEHVTGAESHKQTGEPHAPADARPTDVQSFTFCFALEHRPGEDHMIARPAEYDFWRSYVPPWHTDGRPLFAWLDQSQPNRRYGFDPDHDKTTDRPNLWTYRRIVDKRLFAPGSVPGDVTIVNWPQNDYTLGPLHAVPEPDAAKNRALARALSLSLVYWLQTEAPRADGKAGWPGLRLAKEFVGSDDGLALYPYVRESRRIKAEFTVLEQHVVEELRRKETGLPKDQVRAVSFADSVGIGHYMLDLHASAGGSPRVDLPTLPFQIPLGSFIPVRVQNLLPACKNLGVTHLTNGCYRLHPIEWGIGEAAGVLAAFCLARHESPRRVRNHGPLLAEFQKRLRDDGFELEWDAILKRP